jgi:hypothetical protein
MTGHTAGQSSHVLTGAAVALQVATVRAITGVLALLEALAESVWLAKGGRR